MSSNFRICVHKNSDSLHLKLSGDFDGSSALQLINHLKKKGRGISRVFIHTNSLNEIHPFGQEVFQRNLTALDQQSVSYVFTGENAVQLAPE